MIKSTKNLFALPNKILLMESNPLFAPQHAPTTFPITTLRNRLNGLQTRAEAHQEFQLLSVQEEKAILLFCQTLDDWGHLVTIKILKQFAQSLLPGKRSAMAHGKRRAMAHGK